MKIYALRGKNLILSNDLSEKYARPMAELANDEEIARNLAAHTFPYPYLEEHARYFFDMNREDGEDFFAIDFLIFAKEQLVGVIGLKDLNRIDMNAHIGYWIGREHWNRGYATEALSLMIEFSRKEIGLVRLYSKILDYNLASLRVMMKNGFEVEGFERNSYRMDDRYHSMFIVGKLL